MCRDCFDKQYYGFPSYTEYEEFEEILDLKIRSKKIFFCNLAKRHQFFVILTQANTNSINNYGFSNYTRHKNISID